MEAKFARTQMRFAGAQMPFTEDQDNDPSSRVEASRSGVQHMGLGAIGRSRIPIALTRFVKARPYPSLYGSDRRHVPRECFHDLLRQPLRRRGLVTANHNSCRRPWLCPTGRRGSSSGSLSKCVDRFRGRRLAARKRFEQLRITIYLRPTFFFCRFFFFFPGGMGCGLSARSLPLKLICFFIKRPEQEGMRNRLSHSAISQ